MRAFSEILCDGESLRARNRTALLPQAVLQPTGHSVAAKARAFYQTLGLGLLKQGLP